MPGSPTPDGGVFGSSAKTGRHSPFSKRGKPLCSGLVEFPIFRAAQYVFEIQLLSSPLPSPSSKIGRWPFICAYLDTQ
jgi:hypothetical protein